MEQPKNLEREEPEMFRILHMIICTSDGRLPESSIEDKKALGVCVDRKLVAVSPMEGCIATSEGMRWYEAYKASTETNG